MKSPLLFHLLFVGLPLLTLMVREAPEAAPAAPPAQGSTATGRRDSDVAPKKNSSSAPTAPAARNQSATPKYLFM